MKRNFGLRPKIETAEATIGGLYFVFTAIAVVVCVLLVR